VEHSEDDFIVTRHWIQDYTWAVHAPTPSSR